MLPALVTERYIVVMSMLPRMPHNMTIAISKDFDSLQAIDIINPATLSVVATITKDQSGSPLTNAGSQGNPVNQSRTWNDGVFLEARAQAP